MTTFAQHADLDGRLLWWGMEVSFDDFVTIDYRWSTLSASVDTGGGAAQFEERLAAIGNIQRGFGNDHLPVASTVSMVVENVDSGADWLVNRTTVASQVMRARFRLYCGLADPETPTIMTQVVGTFTCLDFPTRRAGKVQLTLADESLGKLNDFLVPPSFKDWYEDAGTTTSNSCFGGVLFDPKVLADWKLPAPLQFGMSPYYGCVPLATWVQPRTPVDFGVSDGFTAGHRNFIFPVMVCATRDTASAVAAGDVVQLQGVYRNDVLTDDLYQFSQKGPLSIPSTFNDGTTTCRIWKAYKTQTITKDGYDWKLLWIAFDALQFIRYMDGNRPLALGGGTPQVNLPSSPDYPPAQYVPYYATPGVGVVDTYFAAFDSFTVYIGGPGSQVTGNSDINRQGNAVDIMQDLLEQYSSLGSVSSTHFDEARLVTRIRVGGSVRPGLDRAKAELQQNTKASPYGIGTLRRTIADLAATADLDVFVTKAGAGAVVAQGATFSTQTTTPASIDEERTGGVEDHIPSQGERWEPYNRVFVSSAGGLVGPFDDADAITEWGQIRPRVLGSKWWWKLNEYGPDNLGTVDTDVWGLRNLEAKVRPAISFVTDIFALTLELGDYFTLSWTRGGTSAVYSAARWRLESMNIIPKSGAIECTAVWMDDLATEQPFLLDNESLLLRVAASGGRTCTVTDGSDIVTFSSGNLVSDGVVAGDIIRLRDATEGATGFTRNRDLKIKTVDSATQVTLSPAMDTDFGTAGAHAVAAWSIIASYLTYPSAGTDPANYPSGSAPYGKVASTSGQFSNTDAANKLLDG